MNTKLSRNVSLLEGPVLKRMLIFVVQISATSILQQLFTSADMAIVGRFVSDAALAAVGCTAPLISLFIEFFLGLSNSTNVIVSRFIGEKNIEKAKSAVSTSLCVAFMCGLFVGAIGMILCENLLALMSVPEELLGESALYLRIYFAGMPFFMIYNFSAAVMRSQGDTTRPLICLSSAGLINVILNVVFVKAFSMGVAGVAFATVISNAISAFSMVILLVRNSEVGLDIRKFVFDKDILKSIFKIGLPSGFLGSVFSISNVCVQSAINSLDTAVISASVAAVNVEIYIQFFGNAFAQTTTTFISQNYGAKNYKRCAHILKTSLTACVTITVILSALLLIFHKPLLSIFVSDSAVIENSNEPYEVYRSV